MGKVRHVASALAVCFANLAHKTTLEASAMAEHCITRAKILTIFG